MSNYGWRMPPGAVALVGEDLPEVILLTPHSDPPAVDVDFFWLPTGEVIARCYFGDVAKDVSLGLIATRAAWSDDTNYRVAARVAARRYLKQSH